MAVLSGKCLCGEISYETDAEPAVVANCHCTDCRAATGAAYATLMFVPRDKVTIRGETKTFTHASESGSTMTKHFCPTCGSPMFTENTAREGVLGLRGGNVEQTDKVKPMRNVFLSSKIPSTPLDPDLPGDQKMPG
ncbi:MAG: GFA family protein [Rhodospirillaceae bacterium]|nr:GFA family protein [Rhodospirillaceae bacterium]